MRVWLNSDFADNQAEDLLNNTHYRGVGGDECQMVNDIMGIILENSDEAEGPSLKLSDFY